MSDRAHKQQMDPYDDALEIIDRPYPLEKDGTYGGYLGATALGKYCY